MISTHRLSSLVLTESRSSRYADGAFSLERSLKGEVRTPASSSSPAPLHSLSFRRYARLSSHLRPPLPRPAASTPPSFFRRSASRRVSLRWTQRRPTTSGAPRTGARCPTPRQDLGEISATSRRDLGDASAISQPLPHRPLGTPTSLSSPPSRAVDRYTQPTTLALAAASSPDAAEALKALPAFYDARGVTTQQFTAASADGTAARAPPPPGAGEGRGVVGRGEQLRAAPRYPRRAASGCQIWGDVARYGEVWSVAASRCRTSSSARRGCRSTARRRRCSTGDGGLEGPEGLEGRLSPLGLNAPCCWTGTAASRSA